MNVEKMRTEKRLQRAHFLNQQLAQQSTRLHNNRTVRGTDPNELKKLYAVLCQTQDLMHLRSLLDQLIRSPFCRTTRTRIYYQHIKNVLERNRVFELDVDEALEILGWLARLVKKM